MSDTAAPKKRRARSPSKARPAYVIIQVLDDAGQPMEFSKKRIHVVGVERNPAAVVEYALNDDGKSNNLVLKIDVPASPNSRPALAAAA